MKQLTSGIGRQYSFVCSFRRVDETVFSVEIRLITNRWINLVAFFRIQSNLLKTLMNCTLLKLKNKFLNLEIIPGETIPVRKILGKKKYCIVDSAMNKAKT
jgi:hypothetical protein